MQGSDRKKKIGDSILKFFLMPLAGVSVFLSIILWICYAALSDPSINELNAAYAFTIIAGILWIGIFIRKCFPDRIITHRIKSDDERARLIEEGQKIIISPHNQQVLVSLFGKLAVIEHQTLIFAMHVFNGKNNREDTKNLRDNLKSYIVAIPYEISKLINYSQLSTALKQLASYDSLTTQQITWALNPQQKACEIVQLILQTIVVNAKQIDTLFQQKQISQETKWNCLDHLYMVMNEFTKGSSNLPDNLHEAIKNILTVVDAMKQLTAQNSIQYLDAAMAQVAHAVAQEIQSSSTTQPKLPELDLRAEKPSQEQRDLGDLAVLAP